jgi:hypothetical protein
MQIWSSGRIDSAPLDLHKLQPNLHNEALRIDRKGLGWAFFGTRVLFREPKLKRYLWLDGFLLPTMMFLCCIFDQKYSIWKIIHFQKVEAFFPIPLKESRFKIYQEKHLQTARRRSLSSSGRVQRSNYHRRRRITYIFFCHPPQQQLHCAELRVFKNSCVIGRSKSWPPAVKRRCNSAAHTYIQE